MKKYKTYIIIGVMLTLIAFVFLFWDDIVKLFSKGKTSDQENPKTNTSNNSSSTNNSHTASNNSAVPSAEQKFNVYAKLNFGISSVDVLAEFNKQKITEIPNGQLIGEYLGTTPDNKYYRVDYGGATALVEKVLTNKKPA